MVQPNKLFIAAGLKCKECESFIDLYLETVYLYKLGFTEENKLFETVLLEDLEEHIKDKHLDRYNAFIRGIN